MAKRKRKFVGRSINGVVFGLSTPDRHKHRGNLQDILKVEPPPEKIAPSSAGFLGLGTVQYPGSRSARSLDPNLIINKPNTVRFTRD